MRFARKFAMTFCNSNVWRIFHRTTVFFLFINRERMWSWLYPFCFNLLFQCFSFMLVSCFGTLKNWWLRKLIAVIWHPHRDESPVFVKITLQKKKCIHLWNWCWIYIFSWNHHVMISSRNFRAKWVMPTNFCEMQNLHHIVEKTGLMERKKSNLREIC